MQPKRNPFLLLPLAICVLLVTLFASALTHESGSRTNNLTGAAVPDFAFTLAEQPGKQFTPADYKGKIYLVNFFASWCTPCRAEHPLLMQLKRKHKVTLVGVTYKDLPKSTRKLLAQMGNPFTLLLSDISGRGGIEWGITGVPETFLIDARGKIRWHRSGPLTAEIVAGELLPKLASLSDKKS